MKGIGACCNGGGEETLEGWIALATVLEGEDILKLILGLELLLNCITLELACCAGNRLLV